MNIKVIKKDGRLVDFDAEKIKSAAKKSVERSEVKDLDYDKLIKDVLTRINGRSEIHVRDLHNIVEISLSKTNKSAAESYKEYRNYKLHFGRIMDDVITKRDEIFYRGDRENANSDSSFVSTKRSLVYKQLNKELYKNFYLSKEERNAINDGFIYIHDLGDRLDTFNCCLFDISNVLKGGFNLANMRYNEPNTLTAAFAVISDVTLAAAAQQYGGFTLPEIDTVLLPYAQKSWDLYYNEALEYMSKDKAFSYAAKKLEKDMEQGFQSWEYKFNTLASSRGDYPFITITLGLNKHPFAKMLNKICLDVRKNGQGEKGKKRIVLFPKIVFLYDEQLHGKGKELEDVFLAAIDCSSKALYPDYLSLTGDGYVADIYKKTGLAISPMGCRAYLSPWYRNGGIKPQKNDEMVFIGRANAGAISLNLPMIYQESKDKNIGFYTLLDHYLEMIRELHIRTKDYLCTLKASINPLAFMEGGLYKGNLDPNESIRPVVDAMTFSYGITSLNELQYLYNNKELHEDSGFATDVVRYINHSIEEFRDIDNILYAVYGTPAESLSSTQLQQFRNRYGIIQGVSSREYFTNSFHAPVWADIDPIQKQDIEYELFHLFNGGHIQYCRYPHGKNTDAIISVVRRAMDMGFYEGVNIEKNFCDDCGHQFDDDPYHPSDSCPHCGGDNITQINRVCGYIGYSKINKGSRMNDGKLAEIKDRRSM